MNDPHVVLGVDRNPDGHAEQPLVGQRLRPQRVDLEHRGFDHRALLRRGLALHHDHAGTEADQARHEGDAAQQVMSLH